MTWTAAQDCSCLNIRAQETLWPRTDFEELWVWPGSISDPAEGTEWLVTTSVLSIQHPLCARTDSDSNDKNHRLFIWCESFQTLHSYLKFLFVIVFCPWTLRYKKLREDRGCVRCLLLWKNIYHQQLKRRNSLSYLTIPGISVHCPGLVCFWTYVGSERRGRRIMGQTLFRSLWTGSRGRNTRGWKAG